MNLVEAILASSLLLTLSVAQHHAARATSQAWHIATQKQAARAQLRRIDHLGCQEGAPRSFTLRTVQSPNTQQSHFVRCNAPNKDGALRCVITPAISGFSERIVFCARY